MIVDELRRHASSSQAIQLDHDEDIAGRMKSRIEASSLRPLRGAARHRLGSDERAACAFELGLLVAVSCRVADQRPQPIKRVSGERRRNTARPCRPAFSSLGCRLQLGWKMRIFPRRLLAMVLAARWPTPLSRTCLYRHVSDNIGDSGRVEPATCRLEGGCSIQLSYGAEGSEWHRSCSMRPGNDPVGREIVRIGQDFARDRSSAPRPGRRRRCVRRRRPPPPWCRNGASPGSACRPNSSSPSRARSRGAFRARIRAASCPSPRPDCMALRAG